MQRFVVLLRGINVGGRNTLPMADLRAMCEGIGCTDVSTYIQSGNVLLGSSLAAPTLAATLEKALDEALPFSPRVIVRDVADIQRVIDGNPYPDAADRLLHVGFMSGAPAQEALAELGDRDCAPERYAVRGTEIYLDYVEGAGRSKKLGKIAFERILGVAITARNLRTVVKLRDLASG